VDKVGSRDFSVVEIALPIRRYARVMVEMPEEVAVMALANGEPLAGAAFNVTLATTKNGLGLHCPARSDKRGEARLRGVDLERWEAETRSLAMMDYGPLTGQLYVGVVNQATSRAVERASTPGEPSTSPTRTSLGSTLWKRLLKRCRGGPNYEPSSG